jgi:hypothetical protein
MKKTILFFGMLFNCVSISFSQIIWSEDFSTQANGATNDPGRWSAATAGQCDGETFPGVVAGNFWGVNAATQEFRCNDIEGVTCCGTTGASDNVWLTNNINIFGFANISISIDSRVTGAVECTGCGTGGDLFVAAYSVDGAAFVNFDTICGAASGFTNSDCITVGAGTNLRIRVTLGNQANDENYFFDNVIVDGTPCAPLPVSLTGFYVSCMTDNNVKVKWSTATETNNSHFIIQGSTDAINFIDLSRIEGNGNSNSTLNYTESILNNNHYTYFRLVQVDFDGQTKTYDPVYLKCGDEIIKFKATCSNNQIGLILPSGISNDVHMNVTDMSGKMVISEPIYNGTPGQNIIIPIPTTIAAGIYIITIQDYKSGETFYTKFFRN